MPSKGTFQRATVTLTDANVNGGVAVIIPTDSETTKIDVYSKAGEVAFSDLTTDFSTRLAPGRYSGFGNPSLTLKGYMYIGEDTPNTLTPSLLESFVASSAKKTLSSNAWGNISVLIKSVTVSDTMTINGLCDVTIELIRVA